MADDTPRIDRVYTRGGDKGETSLVGGQRVAKDDGRIEAYGTVDELNAVVGWVRAEIAASGTAAAAGSPSLSDVDAHLSHVQHMLFNIGSDLATLPADRHPDRPQVTPESIVALETAMDAANAGLPRLRNFVLPGGSRLNAALHVARTVCRRAERLVVGLERVDHDDGLDVQYLNRLSDAFFVWSRLAAARLGHAEVLWQPDQA